MSAMQHLCHEMDAIQKAFEKISREAAWGTDTSDVVYILEQCKQGLNALAALRAARQIEGS